MHLKTLILLVHLLFMGCKCAMLPAKVQTKGIDYSHVTQIVFINSGCKPGEQSTLLFPRAQPEKCDEVVGVVKEQLRNVTDLLVLNKKYCDSQKKEIREQSSLQFSKNCDARIREVNQNCDKKVKDCSSGCDERMEKVLKDMEKRASAKLDRNIKLCEDQKKQILANHSKNCVTEIQEVIKQCSAKEEACYAKCDKQVLAESYKTIEKLQMQLNQKTAICESQIKKISDQAKVESENCVARVEQANKKCAANEKDCTARCNKLKDQALIPVNEKLKSLTAELSKKKISCENEKKRIRENGELNLKNCEQKAQQGSKTCLPPKKSVVVNQAIAKNLVSLYPGSKYYISTEMLSWHMAGKFCKNNNMQLTSIESAAENNALGKAVRKNEFYWLSGTDLGSEGKFYWDSNGKDIKFFANFNTAQPDNHRGNEHCVHSYNYGKGFQWNDYPCNVLSKFICEVNDG